MKQRLQAKFRGALLASAVGDALGAPFEGGGAMPQAAALQWGADGFSFCYTDDTHMTLGVAESLVERGGFDGPHMAQVFVRNYTAEPWRGYGAGPPRVFRALADGAAWDAASAALFNGVGSYGNGAAMRIAPAALVAFRQLEHVASLAHNISIITHRHPLGIEGAVLQACAIAVLIQQPVDRPLDAAAFIEALRPYVHDPVFVSKLDRVLALLPHGTLDQVCTQLGTGIAAHESVPTALYAFLRSPQSFSEAVTYAISLGGDTDTIAAMTGALVGAYQGETAIPEVAREQVEGSTTITALADALLNLTLGLVPIGRPVDGQPRVRTV